MTGKRRQKTDKSGDTKTGAPSDGHGAPSTPATTAASSVAPDTVRDSLDSMGAPSGLANALVEGATELQEATAGAVGTPLMAGVATEESFSVSTIATDRAGLNRRSPAPAPNTTGTKVTAPSDPKSKKKTPKFNRILRGLAINMDDTGGRPSTSRRRKSRAPDGDMKTVTKKDAADGQPQSDSEHEDGKAPEPEQPSQDRTDAEHTTAGSAGNTRAPAGDGTKSPDDTEFKEGDEVVSLATLAVPVLNAAKHDAPVDAEHLEEIEDSLSELQTPTTRSWGAPWSARPSSGPMSLHELVAQYVDVLIHEKHVPDYMGDEIKAGIIRLIPDDYAQLRVLPETDMRRMANDAIANVVVACNKKFIESGIKQPFTSRIRTDTAYTAMLISLMPRIAADMFGRLNDGIRGNQHVRFPTVEEVCNRVAQRAKVRDTYQRFYTVVSDMYNKMHEHGIKAWTIPATQSKSGPQPERASRGDIYAGLGYSRLSGREPGPRQPPSPSKHKWIWKGTDKSAALKYPDIAPWKAYTHYEGRWDNHPTYTEEVVWYFYDQPITATEQLPLNTPEIQARPDHWVNRMLPSGKWTTSYQPNVQIPYQRGQGKPSIYLGPNHDPGRYSDDYVEVLHTSGLRDDGSVHSGQKPQALQTAFDAAGKSAKPGKKQGSTHFADSDDVHEYDRDAPTKDVKKRSSPPTTQPPAGGSGESDPGTDGDASDDDSSSWGSINDEEWAYLIYLAHLPAVTHPRDKRFLKTLHIKDIKEWYRHNVQPPPDSTSGDATSQGQSNPAGDGRTPPNGTGPGKPNKGSYPQPTGGYPGGVPTVGQTQGRTHTQPKVGIYEPVHPNRGQQDGPSDGVSPLSGSFGPQEPPKPRRHTDPQFHSGMNHGMNHGMNFQNPGRAPPPRRGVPTYAPPQSHHGHYDSSGQYSAHSMHTAPPMPGGSMSTFPGSFPSSIGTFRGSTPSGVPFPPSRPPNHGTRGHRPPFGGQRPPFDPRASAPPDRGGDGGDSGGGYHGRRSPFDPRRGTPPDHGGGGNGPPDPSRYHGHNGGHPGGNGGGGGGGGPGGDPHFDPGFPPHILPTIKAKPDRKDYPVLQSDEQYPTWRNNLQATLYAHQLQIVLAMDFVPRTQQEHDSFWSINYWVYMVLTHIVKTVDGKGIVYTQRFTYDAREVLHQLHAHYTVSTAGVINAQRIMEWLTTAKLDSGWTKPYTDWLLMWERRADTYNEHCDPSNVLGDMLLKQLLQRSVNHIPAFRQIMNDEHQSIVRGHGPLTLRQYFLLAKSQAETQDHQSGRSSSLKSSAYFTEVTEPDGGDDVNDTLAINRADVRTRLPQPLFEGLSDEDRRGWIKMSAEGKAKIVGQLRPVDLPKAGTVARTRKVNFAGTTDGQTEPATTDDDAEAALSAALSVNKAVTSPSATSTAKKAAPQSSTKPASKRTAAKQAAIRDAHPADMRRLLASRPAGEAPPVEANTTQQHFNVRWDPLPGDDNSLSYLGDADDDSSIESLHLDNMPSTMLEAMYTSVDDYADDESHPASSNLWCGRGADDESETWDSDFP